MAATRKREEVNILAGLTNLTNKQEKPNITSEPVLNDIVIEKESALKEEPIVEVSTLVKASSPDKLSKGGRPKKYDKSPNRLTVYLSDEDYWFLKEHCGRHNGMTGYVEYLIQEERKRISN